MPPTARNHVWALDFIFDSCANGQKLKCLTIIDEWTRERWRSTLPEAFAPVG
jgi:putative transposase